MYWRAAFLPHREQEENQGVWQEGQVGDQAACEPSGSTPQCQQVTPQPLEDETKGAGGGGGERGAEGKDLSQEPQHPPVSLTSAPWRWAGQERPSLLSPQK